MWKLGDLIWTGMGIFLELHQAEACLNPLVGCWLEAELLKSPLLPPPPTPPVHTTTVFKGPETSELVIWPTAVAGHWGLIGLHCSGGFSGPLPSILFWPKDSTKSVFSSAESTWMYRFSSVLWCTCDDKLFLNKVTWTWIVWKLSEWMFKMNS